MRAAFSRAVLVAVATCLALLVSCALAWAPAGLTWLAAPVVLFVATYLLVVLGRLRATSADGAPDSRASAVRRIGVVCVSLVVGSLILLALDLPARVAFVVWRHDFDRTAGAFHPGEPWRQVGRYVGPYRIDMITRDERGGLYIRVREESGILETYSYGFAHDANAEGTPFGDAGYARTHLRGGWSWFAVNDDW